MRLELMSSFLDYCERILKENKDAIFILDRFHITYYFVALERPDGNARYQEIIRRLKNFPVHIYVPFVSDEEIEQRSAHRERKDIIWETHLKKRLEQRGFSNLRDMYSTEQHETRKLLEIQGIPYSAIEVKPPHA